MKSRGKKKDVPQEARPMAEVFYEAASAHLLMMARAEKRARERLGIEPPKPKQKLLEQKNDGTFFYKNKQIMNDPDTQYMRVFRAIFEITKSEEYATYSRINHWLEEYGETEIIDNKEATKRIQNGVNEFFRKTKIPTRLPDGKKLIDYKRGRGVILLNPDVG